jgi:glycolate oxidase FAD binding subunit
VILEVSLKVLPRPAAEATQRLELPQAKALEALNRWGGQPLPVSASAWCGGQLSLRLSGSESAVRAAALTIGGEALPSAERFWAGIREQSDLFFAGAAPLWRVSLPSTSAPLELPGEPLIEWGGALRWLRSDADADAVRAAAARVGGHATLFRGGDKRAGVFAPLAPALARLHRELKSAFDPAGIFNPGRLYPEL